MIVPKIWYFHSQAMFLCICTNTKRLFSITPPTLPCFIQGRLATTLLTVKNAETSDNSTNIFQYCFTLHRISRFLNFSSNIFFVRCVFWWLLESFFVNFLLYHNCYIKLRSRGFIFDRGSLFSEWWQKISFWFVTISEMNFLTVTIFFSNPPRAPMSVRAILRLFTCVAFFTSVDFLDDSCIVVNTWIVRHVMTWNIVRSKNLALFFSIWMQVIVDSLISIFKSIMLNDLFNKRRHKFIH